MQISKKKVSTVVKIISFVMVAAVLLGVLSVTAFSKEAGGVKYRNVKNKLYSFYFEPDESIQLVGIGNSDLYSGFVPTVLYEEHGITSQMMGSPYQTPLQAYYYLKEIFKYQTPEVVMIEVDMLYDEPPGEQEPERTKRDVLFHYCNTDDFQAMIEDKLPIFSFHDRWKSLIKRNTELRTPNSHGYKYFSKVDKIKYEPYMFETDEKEPVHQYRLHQLDKVMQLCAQEGAEVFFIEMPTTNSWSYERHNTAVEIAEKYGTVFLDLNLLIDEIGLDFENSFRDKGNHLNYEGAKKVTSYLGTFIDANYPMETQNGNKRWEQSLIDFERERLREDKRRAEQEEE